MDFKVVFKNEVESETLSQAYTKAMDGILSADKDVISMDADLMHAVGIQNIMDKYPGRVMDVGIAEADMAGIAAGLAYGGKKPFIQSFACFVTRRAFDQIFISAAYGRNSIKIFGSDPGICAAYNGGTHMPFEDLGAMRTIPGATIIDITDNAMMADMIPKLKDLEGVVYFRASRAAVRKVYAGGSKFEIGKGAVLKDGGDVAIITGGLLVPEALLAAEELSKNNIDAAVIDMYSIKPIDAELIVEYARKTGAVVATDNHNVNGGLCDAVAAVLADRCPTPMKRVAVFDEFGEVGSLEFLMDRFNLNAKTIVERAGEVLKMKK